MSTHLYCVLPAGGVMPSAVRGIDDAPVRALPFGDLVGWVSDVARSASVSIDGVKAHDRVVQAALDTGTTPIPARYGQRFDTDAACLDALRRNEASVRDALSGVQGFVEMTLLLTPSTRRMISDLEPVLPEMVGDQPGIGRRYLETLRAREAATGTIRRALDGLAARLAEAGQRFIRRVAVQEGLSKIPIRTVSHLVRRELVDQYRAAVESVLPPADSRFLVIGPRAPYSFSKLGPGDSGLHGMKLAD